MKNIETPIMTFVLSDVKNAGTVLQLLKDFNIYQKSRQSILMRVVVPKSLIGAEIKKQCFDTNGQMMTESGVYTALKMGMARIDNEGRKTITQSYYLRFLKEEQDDRGGYYLYERMWPSEFSLVSGTGINAPCVLFNLVNILNNITIEGDKTIINEPTELNLFTSQECKVDILPSSVLDTDPLAEPTEWDLLQGQVNKLIQQGGNKADISTTLLRYDLNGDLPIDVKFSRDGYKSPGVLFSNAAYEIPNLDYETDLQEGSVLVVNLKHEKSVIMQTELFIYGSGVAQRVIKLNDDLSVASVGEWAVKVDRKQNLSHVGEFLYVDKNGNINFTKALKDLITKANGEVLTNDTSAYDFSSMFEIVKRNKEEVFVDGSAELKSVLKNIDYDLDTAQLKLARFNAEEFVLQLPTKLSQFDNDTKFITKEVDNLTNYVLRDKVGNKLTFSLDQKTYILTINLLNPQDEIISTASVDFPLESMIIDGRYENGYVYLMLKSGTEIRFSIAALISGLVPSTRKINGQTLDKDVNIFIPENLADLAEDATHRTVTDEEKAFWNNKDYNSLENLPVIPEGVEVVDNFNSTDTKKSLSANKGKELYETKAEKTDVNSKFQTLDEKTDSIEANISTNTQNIENEATTRANADVNLQNNINKCVPKASKTNNTTLNSGTFSYIQNENGSITISSEHRNTKKSVAITLYPADDGSIAISSIDNNTTENIANKTMHVKIGFSGIKIVHLEDNGAGGYNNVEDLFISKSGEITTRNGIFKVNGKVETTNNSIKIGGGTISYDAATDTFII